MPPTFTPQPTSSMIPPEVCLVPAWAPTMTTPSPPPPPTMATHTELALHFTAFETQSRHRAHFFPQTPPTTTHYQPTRSVHFPQTTRTHRPPGPHQALQSILRRRPPPTIRQVHRLGGIRMATSLEEPGRSRALHLLNQALKYRNLTPPKSNVSNVPMTFPFLAHSDFQANTQRWLVKLLQCHKHYAIPLHLPTCRLRKAAQNLHDHRKWEDALQAAPHHDPTTPPPA